MIGRKTIKKRIKWLAFLIFWVFIALIVRTGYLQFFEGERLKELAYIQQTSDRNINPRRGTMFDTTGTKELAVSSFVETVTVNPRNIIEKEKVARKLSDLFELDYDKVLSKLNKNIMIETIAKKVDKEKTNELRKWMLENKILSGINIDEDTKRFYPYNNLASQVIGL